MNVRIPPAVVARAQRLQAQLARSRLLGSIAVEDVLFMAILHGLDGLEDRLRQEVAHGTKEA